MQTIIHAHQLELYFPEYEFKVGDIVRILGDRRYTHDPFIIIKRIYYDERPYGKRVDEHGTTNELLTGWYYSCKAVTSRQRETHFRRTHVSAHDLELWKWEDKDSVWKI